MVKRNKQASLRPDEMFSSGPFTVARFGKVVHWRADWDEDSFKEYQAERAASYPKVIEEIDGLVANIATTVSALPPKVLLHRAWGEMAVRHIKLESEADIEDDDALSIRMMDYVQSIIASVLPSESRRHDVPEDDWIKLRKTIAALFNILNSSYQMCRTAKAKKDDPALNMDVEEFFFKAQVLWCNVRGRRYQIHEPEYLRQMFLPHSDVLLELFGISGETFVNELAKIWHAHSFGLGDALGSLDDFRQDVLRVTQERIEAGNLLPREDFQKLMHRVVEEEGWTNRRDEVFGRFLGTDLFDLRKTTALPEPLLAELAWSPGEDRDFFAPGKYSGWPLRVWPIFKRPFIKLDGQYYCFDHYSLFDNIYRVMQRIILRNKPTYAETWNSIQRSISETLPIEYFQRILPGANVLKGIYYPGKTEHGAEDWCEVDGLVMYSDHLFVIETRGGAFTYTPPATDFPAWIASLKNLVLKPASQGVRFLEYLRSDETVTLYNNEHKRVDDIRLSDFRHVTICAVTLDPFTEIAAQVQHLRKIGVDVGTDPIWAISVDDLRVYADIFENPLIFLHFVEQRIKAFRSSTIQLDDEIDHFGLYVEFNHYVSYIEATQKEASAHVQFVGYRSDVDKFFSARMLDPDVACDLRQDIPSRILEIIEWLSENGDSRRAKIVSYLLDLEESWRETIAKKIDEELQSQVTVARVRPFSLHGRQGQTNLTLFAHRIDRAKYDHSSALDHTRTVALVNNDEDRILLCLKYNETEQLEGVTWNEIRLGDIPKEKMPKLRAKAAQLRRRRVELAKAERKKIGRNEQCPCGSGRKYKKCCLGRS